MPSVSKKQHNLMAAVAHNPGFAKKVGIPQSVGKDFSDADKGKKFKEGGVMKNASPAMERRHAAWMKSHGAPKKMVAEESAEADEEKGEPKGFRKGGVSRGKMKVPKAPKASKAPKSPKGPPMDPAALAALAAPPPGAPPGPESAGPGAPPGMGGGMPPGMGMKKGGKACGMARGGGIESKGKTNHKTVRMATGGSVTRGDGCATKGKTKGRVC